MDPGGTILYILVVLHRLETMNNIMDARILITKYVLHGLKGFFSVVQVSQGTV